MYIRGAEARHTILLIDGVRYGSATLGTPVWDNIPVELIDRIEVVKGPGSALYGGDGVGGVVQIFTRKAAPGETVFNPRASTTIGSDSYKQITGGFSGGAGAATYSLDVTRTLGQQRLGRPTATCSSATSTLTAIRSRRPAPTLPSATSSTRTGSSTPACCTPMA